MVTLSKWRWKTDIYDLSPFRGEFREFLLAGQAFSHPECCSFPLFLGRRTREAGFRPTRGKSRPKCAPSLPLDSPPATARLRLTTSLDSHPTSSSSPPFLCSEDELGVGGDYNVVRTPLGNGTRRLRQGCFQGRFDQGCRSRFLPFFKIVRSHSRFWDECPQIECPRNFSQIGQYLPIAPGELKFPM